MCNYSHVCPPFWTDCHTQLFSFRSNPPVGPSIALQIVVAAVVALILEEQSAAEMALDLQLWAFAFYRGSFISRREVMIPQALVRFDQHRRSARM